MEDFNEKIFDTFKWRCGAYGRDGRFCVCAGTSPAAISEHDIFHHLAPGPNGANFGGIEGADKHCGDLAAKAGAGGKAWRAYLSQQAMGGKPAVNAKDRIGKGPWVNTAGKEIAANVADLHDPAKANINVETGITETGKQVMSRLFVVNYHSSPARMPMVPRLRPTRT